MLTTTIIFTGIFLLMHTALSITTSANRAKYDIDFGDGGNQAMHKAIRAQGNFVEYVPILLIAMGASEYIGAPEWLIWTCGWVLVVSRMSHAAFMLGFAGKPARLVGAGLSFLLMIVLGLYLLGRGTGLIA
ncbi:MAPEG family protein [Hoeflea sp. TYP-13]|uniref:MAPEG family protein n=1 Tax=Hoeflea sp. TYP-13 TaxID=3230023 RepID=UPI0034C5BDB5